MPEFQILTCPKCKGRGCPVCQNTGRVKVSTKQLQKIKQMVGQINPMIQSSPVPMPPPTTNFKKARFNTNLAGIITFSIFSIIAGAGAASWYFLKSFKPFFACLTSLLTLIGTRLAWQHPFFQPQQPNDFLAAINKKSQ